MGETEAAGGERSSDEGAKKPTQPTEPPIFLKGQQQQLLAKQQVHSILMSHFVLLFSSIDLQFTANMHDL